MTIYNEATSFQDDPDMFFALTERGAHGHSPGRTDATAGDLAVAGQTRICGRDQLNPLIYHLFEALRAGGWKQGDSLSAEVGHDTHDEKAARSWSVRESIAYARIMAVTVGRPDPDAAMAVLYDTNLPDEAVRCRAYNDRSKDGGGMLVIKLRYLSDGMAINGENELKQELHMANIAIVSGDSKI